MTRCLFAFAGVHDCVCRTPKDSRFFGVKILGDLFFRGIQAIEQAETSLLLYFGPDYRVFQDTTPYDPEG